MKRIIVIKIGSSILMTHRGKPDEFRLSHLAEQIATLQAGGKGIILVVSGAVACGHKFINFSEGELFLRRAAAGIGQAILTASLNSVFGRKKIRTAQLLLTKSSLEKDPGRKDIKSLLGFYAASGFITVINENDVLELNSFGGNDYLAAAIAQLVNAERLLILSTYDRSLFGVGGAETKRGILGLMRATNIETAIVNGKERDIILKAIL